MKGAPRLRKADREEARRRLREWQVAASTGDAALLREMLSEGFDVGAKDQAGGLTAVALAAGAGQAECLALLLSAGGDPGGWNAMGWSPAMSACSSHRAECLALLIGAGLDVDAKSPEGWTAALIAAANASHDCLALLIEAGADLSPKDPSGRSIEELGPDEFRSELVEFLASARLARELDAKLPRSPSSAKRPKAL